ncbi:non-homologous end joining protein Ku [Streptomyces chartreusis]|uniref:non-homologous end joining protein Ku n=1 Tax=Streptomyces chartreusis TaxID=1969 RepID=UPI0037967C49
MAVFVALLPVAIPALGGLSPVLFTFYGAAFHVRAEEMDVAAAWQFAASVYVVAIMGRVRVRKYCEVEDREVTNAEIGKGYQLTKEQVIPISDEELREIPLPTAKAIEIEAFVPLESIDPIRIGEGYYLQPSGQVAAKPYRLLVQALGRSSKVAITKYAWSGRDRLGVLRVKDDVIVLHAMRWPDEIRDPAELLPEPVELIEDEIDGALALMDSMVRDDLDDPEFRDTYTDALAKVIEAKRDDKPLPKAPEPDETGGKVLDLMTALNESVAKAKASRSEDQAEANERPKKKTAAKKQPAKRTTAKKAARKASARRPRSA